MITIEKIYNRIRYGTSLHYYDDIACLDITIAKFTLPKLKRFRDYYINEAYSCPLLLQEDFPMTADEICNMPDDIYTKMKTKWIEILDEMIWAFQYIIDDDKYFLDLFCDIDYKDGDITNNSFTNMKVNTNYDKLKEYEDRYDRGMMYFARYMRSLSD